MFLQLHLSTEAHKFVSLQQQVKDQKFGLDELKYLPNLLQINKAEQEIS